MSGIALCGCGGIASNGLLDTGSDGGGAASGGDVVDATAAVDTGAGQGSATGGGSGGDVDAGVDAGGGGFGGGAPDGGWLDGAPPIARDAGAADASHGGSTGDGVRCGVDAKGATKACAPGAVCCVTAAGNGMATFDCEPAASACGGLVVPCDDRRDCPAGTVCCGQTGPSGQYSMFQCQTSCDVNQAQYEMCDPAESPSECAASGLRCLASGVLYGYYRCAP